VKPESKFWQLVKKNTPQIQWTRLESWASFGVPRAVKLYESSQMEELLTMGHAARPLVQDDWNAIQEALIAGL
jgi:hypothetical protein